MFHGYGDINKIDTLNKVLPKSVICSSLFMYSSIDQFQHTIGILSILDLHDIFLLNAVNRNQSYLSSISYYFVDSQLSLFKSRSF